MSVVSCSSNSSSSSESYARGEGGFNEPVGKPIPSDGAVMEVLFLTAKEGGGNGLGRV